MQCDVELECINYSVGSVYGICKKKIGAECNSILECEPSSVGCNVVCY